jgi:hypothetical protein
MPRQYGGEGRLHNKSPQLELLFGWRSSCGPAIEQTTDGALGMTSRRLRRVYRKNDASAANPPFCRGTRLIVCVDARLLAHLYSDLRCERLQAQNALVSWLAFGSV